MLCWTQTLCWSSSCSLRAKSSSSAFRSISLSAISLVLHPGPTPLKHNDSHEETSKYSFTPSLGNILFFVNILLLIRKALHYHSVSCGFSFSFPLMKTIHNWCVLGLPLHPFVFTTQVIIYLNTTTFNSHNSICENYVYYRLRKSNPHFLLTLKLGHYK